MFPEFLCVGVWLARGRIRHRAGDVRAETPRRPGVSRRRRVLFDQATNASNFWQFVCRAFAPNHGGSRPYGIKERNFGLLGLKGFWGAVKVRDGDTFKNRMVIWNKTPPPPAAPSPTTTPSSQYRTLKAIPDGPARQPE